jgi:hypothetical protein
VINGVARSALDGLVRAARESLVRLFSWPVRRSGRCAERTSGLASEPALSAQQQLTSLVSCMKKQFSARDGFGYAEQEFSCKVLERPEYWKGLWAGFDVLELFV